MIEDMRDRLTIPAFKWSRRWAFCRDRWADACAVWLATWKKTGQAYHLASAVKFAQLHEKATKRWLHAVTREGFEL